MIIVLNLIVIFLTLYFLLEINFDNISPFNLRRRKSFQVKLSYLGVNNSLSTSMAVEKRSLNTSKHKKTHSLGNKSFINIPIKISTESVNKDIVLCSSHDDSNDLKLFSNIQVEETTEELKVDEKLKSLSIANFPQCHKNIAKSRHSFRNSLITNAYKNIIPQRLSSTIISMSNVPKILIEKENHFKTINYDHVLLTGVLKRKLITNRPIIFVFFNHILIYILTFYI